MVNALENLALYLVHVNRNIIFDADFFMIRQNGKTLR